MTDLNALSLPDLYRHFASGLVRRLFELARDEDVGPGDATSAACIPAEARSKGAIVARAEGTIAGLALLPDLAAVFGGAVNVEPRISDGQTVARGTTLATLSGPTRAILTLERTALNFIGRLSGVATMTAQFVRAVSAAGPVKARICDTRKTTPGLRVLEKYAVRCGGGFSHRLGLYDAVLIKDNHLAAVPARDLATAVAAAARRARAAHPGLSFVEVEVESLNQLKQVLAIQPGLIDIILLDNMSLEDLRAAVELRDKSGRRLELEASGGIRLENIRQIAQTGVDRISVGALTHGATSLDVALDLDKVAPP